MKQILALILAFALMGASSFSFADEPDPTETMLQLMKLLELKEQHDYAQALEANNERVEAAEVMLEVAATNEYGLAMIQNDEWAEQGKGLVRSHTWLKQGERIQYNSNFSHTQSVVILKQEFLSDWVPEYYLTSVSQINRYSPMGFNYRIERKGDMWDAIESGDIESLDYFKTKHERQSNITKRRNAILNK